MKHRKIHLIALAIFASLELTLWGYYSIFCKVPSKARPTYPPGKYDIICVGDSVIYGYGGKETNIPKEIEKLTGMKTLNAGVCNATTKDTLEQVRELVKLKPKVMIVQAGYCDKFYYEYSPFWNVLRKSSIVKLLMKLNHRPYYTAYDSFQNMEDIERLCMFNMIEYVVITVSTKDHADSWITEYNWWLKMYLDAKNVRLEPKHFFDNIHLNDEGYREFARQVVRKL